MIKMLKLIGLCLAVFLLNSQGLLSQNTLKNKGDKDFERKAYIDAIASYERIANKGYKDQTMFKRLGDAYFFNGTYQEAVKWYTELMAMQTELEPEYYFRYAHALKAIQDNAKADEMMLKFHQVNASDNRGILFKSQKNYREVIENNSHRYQIQNAKINSAFMDFGVTVSDNQLIFASTRDTMSFVKRKHTWHNQPFSSLYSAKITADGNLEEPKKFAKELESAYDESSVCFSKDGEFIYFTRSNFLKKRGKSSEGTTLLKIYRAQKIDNKWQNITELPFNSNEYSCAHPVLSADEKLLYFSSDMPGTLGSSDIFSVSVDANHSNYGTPQNLGKPINTEGRDNFPFIDEQGNLYFSSDGHPGLGGLDVFKANKKDDTFDEPKNVGKPINSTFDDFAYYKIPETSIGFFTSNRTQDNLGFDDIYKFFELEPIKTVEEQLLAGEIIDEQTKTPITNLDVTLSDDQFNDLKSVKTDKNGRYDFGTLPTGKKYYIKAEKEGYETRQVPVFFESSSTQENLAVELSPRVKAYKPGDDIMKAFTYAQNNGTDFRWVIIYFDLDKHQIRSDAAFELEKILDVLIQNPSMHIDVRSHTDCRAPMAYNDKLSDQRAKATMAWLIKNGISKDRLTGKGYGERQLVNDCACEPSNQSPCTEEEHQLNRRSEFIITKM